MTPAKPTRRRDRRTRPLNTLLWLALWLLPGQHPAAQIAPPIRLPNGWSVSPAGRNIPLGDLPLHIAVSPDGRRMAVTNNGQSIHSIQLLDTRSEKVIHTRIVPKAWLGLAFSPDGKTLYASGGHDNRILAFDTRHDTLRPLPDIPLGEPWPHRIGPAGLTTDKSGKRLFVVTREDSSLYVVDLASRSVTAKTPLGAEAYSCTLSPDGQYLYISLWGGDKVLRQDLTTGKSEAWTTGDNPNEIILTRDGKTLFVANANDNSVSVIDTRDGQTLEVLNTAPFPDAPPGSTTNDLSLSKDQKTLYVANADNNCLAVFDISSRGRSRPKGFIPVGWYPTSVRVVGNRIFTANGKGFSSLPNPYGPNPIDKDENVTYQQGDTSKPVDVQYIAGLFKGTLSIVDAPDENTLRAYTGQVYRNIPYTDERRLRPGGQAGNPIPSQVGDPSPIRYVFYIVKENRTYDQVLGDLPQGNGDTSLVLFGDNITPNQHALAREFVLLDNFFVDGEVSADGHNWSLGAYATDYLEKTWPTSYGGRGGNYDAEGNRAIANNPNGFIWDLCRRHGISYRTYGEFADDYKANIPALEGHFCPYFTSWDETVRDTTRFRQWQQEFDSLVAAKALPRLNTLRFINDHTEGLTPGRPTPFAHVADNDLAVGLFIQHLSHSPVWKESVVFIVEDDAQNGPDHVDAHRTTAYVAGGHVKRGYVDHTPYSTASMLRTMELILGLPPMSQFDAAATPLWRCFTPNPDTTPFRARPANVDLNQKNTADNARSRKSLQFDFSREDRAPDLEFSEVIWKAVKGPESPMPPPRRSAFLRHASGE